MTHFETRGNTMKNSEKSKKRTQIQSETQTSDSGRSMVEMLGTLAVIGVLSIAGIAGYNAAMSKYRTNKVSHELNILSNQIQMLMEQKHEDDYELSLGEPYDEGNITQERYGFNFGCGSEAAVDIACSPEETGYYLELWDVPAKECQSLIQLTQHLPHLVDQVVNNVSDTTGSSCVDEENTVALYFDITGEVPEITPIGTAPYITLPPNSEEQKDCKTNRDCDDGEYCYTLSSACNVEIVTEGKCRPATVKEKNPGTSTNYVVSEDTMSWFSAQRFCSALGKRMISYGDLKCADKIDVDSWGYCHASSKPDKLYSYEQSNVSSVVKEIQKAYGNYYGWTSRVGTGDNACFASLFNFYDGLVYDNDRNLNGPAAVCK